MNFLLKRCFSISKKNIGVIYTGGTVGCVGEPLAPMPHEQFTTLSKQIIEPILKTKFNNLSIHFLKFGLKTLDSTDIQPRDWCTLANLILENYNAFSDNPSIKFNGFVVLHGTDSLDFTGSALPFLLSSFDKNGMPTALLDKPVILTGSQLPLFYKSKSVNSKNENDYNLIFNTDAYQNFCGAIECALSPIPEVGIYFSHKLFRSSRALRSQTENFDGYSSPNYPVLAENFERLNLFPKNISSFPSNPKISLSNPDVLASQRDRIRNMLNENHEKSIDKFPVLQFSAFPGYFNKNGAFIADILNKFAELKNLKGVILESYGAGNFPSAQVQEGIQNSEIYKAMSRIRDRGAYIVDCTRVLNGIVDNSVYASGDWLSEFVFKPVDMTPMAAFIKLMILMNDFNQEKDSEIIKKLFEENLLGEMKVANHLNTETRNVLLSGESITAFRKERVLTLINDKELGPILKSKGKNDAEFKIVWNPLNSLQESEKQGTLTLEKKGVISFKSHSQKTVREWPDNSKEHHGHYKLELDIDKKGNDNIIIREFASGGLFLNILT